MAATKPFLAWPLKCVRSSDDLGKRETMGRAGASNAGARPSVITIIVYDPTT